MEALHDEKSQFILVNWRGTAIPLVFGGVGGQRKARGLDGLVRGVDREHSVDLLMNCNWLDQGGAAKPCRLVV